MRKFTTVSAKETLAILMAANIASRRSSDADTPEHAAWMLTRIVGYEIGGEKALVWLGYAQALVRVSGLATLGEIKACNHEPDPEEG